MLDFDPPPPFLNVISQDTAIIPPTVISELDTHPSNRKCKAMTGEICVDQKQESNLGPLNMAPFC